MIPNIKAVSAPRESLARIYHRQDRFRAEDSVGGTPTAATGTVALPEVAQDLGAPSQGSQSLDLVFLVTNHYPLSTLTPESLDLVFAVS
jgi:hypothetical protein